MPFEALKTSTYVQGLPKPAPLLCATRAVETEPLMHHVLCISEENSLSLAHDIYMEQACKLLNKPVHEPRDAQGTPL